MVESYDKEAKRGRGRPRKNSEILFQAPLEFMVRSVLSSMPNCTEEDIVQFITLHPNYLNCIENDKEREEQASKHNVTLVQFSEQNKEALINGIRVIRCKYNKEQEEMQATSEKQNTMKLGDIIYTPVERMSSGINPFDRIFGETPELKQAGMPKGTVSLLAGAKGIGKSRAMISVCCQMSLKGYKCLYFQNEVSFSQFRNWVKNIKFNSDNMIVSSCDILQDQIDVIEQEKPNLVIVDSLQMIKECSTQSGLKIATELYKAISEKHNLHTIFIGQLNKQNEIAGSNKVPYLVDIVLKAEPYLSFHTNHFCIKCDSKNRYGPSDRSAIMYHTDKGVSFLDENDTESNQAKIITILS